MLSSQFIALLKDLEPFFKCKLEPDQHQACLIKMGIGIRIQLELDSYGENLLVGVRLGVIPMSRYRENVFKAALKANGSSSPSTGIFAYSQKTGNLILFATIPFQEADQEKVIATLTPLIAKAHIWAEALSRGDIPILTERPSGQSGLFGLIR